jgi:hypothetical protein
MNRHAQPENTEETPSRRRINVVQDGVSKLLREPNDPHVPATVCTHLEKIFPEHVFYAIEMESKILGLRTTSTVLR